MTPKRINDHRSWRQKRAARRGNDYGHIQMVKEFLVGMELRNLKPKEQTDLHQVLDNVISQ